MINTTIGGDFLGTIGTIGDLFVWIAIQIAIAFFSSLPIRIYDYFTRNTPPSTINLTVYNLFKRPCAKKKKKAIGTKTKKSGTAKSKASSRVTSKG